MKVIRDQLIPNNLPLLQVRKGIVSKCAQKKPVGYLSEDKRAAAVHRLEAMRAAYNLLMRGKFQDPRRGVDTISAFGEDSSIPADRLDGSHIGDVQLGLITEYNNLAERLLSSYSFDICQEAKRQGTTVSPHKALESLSKTKTPPEQGVKGATVRGSVGEHLTDKRHRFFGLPEASAIQLAVDEAKKGSFLTESEINKAFERVARAERDLAKSVCPKPEDTSTSSVAGDEDKGKGSDLSWYNNPWIIATLSIGATVGVHHLVKRSRG